MTWTSRYAVGIGRRVSQCNQTWQQARHLKKVTVECYLDEDVVRIVIQDEGEGFDPNDVPDPTLPENLDKPSGRGVMLMKAFMDDVIYNDVGNQLTFIKRCTFNN